MVSHFACPRGRHCVQLRPGLGLQRMQCERNRMLPSLRKIITIFSNGWIMHRGVWRRDVLRAAGVASKQRSPTIAPMFYDLPEDQYADELAAEIGLIPAGATDRQAFRAVCTQSVEFAGSQVCQVD